jgi:hypothetical protein
MPRNNGPARPDIYDNGRTNRQNPPIGRAQPARGSNCSCLTSAMPVFMTEQNYGHGQLIPPISKEGGGLCTSAGAAGGRPTKRFEISAALSGASRRSRIISSVLTKLDNSDGRHSRQLIIVGQRAGATRLTFPIYSVFFYRRASDLRVGSRATATIVQLTRIAFRISPSPARIHIVD